MGDWASLILEIGEREGHWPGDRHVVTIPARLRPGATDVMALRVSFDKLRDQTGWQPRVSWEEGVRRTIEWYAQSRASWLGRVDWLDGRAASRS
jgi:dTDP-glucose 4,6-dehydratase